MSKCPNCFAQLDKDGVCPACGYQSAAKINNVEKLLEEGKFLEAKAILDEALAKDANDGKANLLMTRVLTKNFGEKPENVDQLKEYAVKGLTYASEKDKALIDYKLLSYFENLNLGGRGVSDVFDIKASIVGGGYATDASGKPVGATGHFSEGGAAAAGASKMRKPLSKKAKIVLLGILGVGVVGAVVGIIVGTTGGKHGGGNGQEQRDSSYTYVTLDKQGGYNGDSYVYAYYNQSLNSIVVPSKSGYTFKGYYSSTNGWGTKYYDQYGSPVISYWDISSSSYTLYAYWESAQTTEVTLNKDGGSGGDSYVYNTYGQSYDSISVPSKSGYTFNGYYSSTGGWGTKYYDNYGYPSQSTWDISSSSYTLYAYWTSSPTPMTTTYVTFDKQGGSSGTSSTTNTYGSSYNSISVPYKSGYTFGGYYTSTYGNGTKYYDQYGDPVKSTWDLDYSSYTLYAYWTSSATETYVTLNKSSGSGGDSYVYNTYGQAYDSIAIPTRSGYIFVGYYTSTDGYGTKYYDKDGYPTQTTWDISSSSYTLYAHWVYASNVTFDKQGGSGGTSSVVNGYALAYESISVPTKSGYTFGGYYTSTDGYGTKYYDENGDPYYSTWGTSSSYVTLYAYWISGPSKTYSIQKVGSYGYTLDTSRNPDSSLYDGVYYSNNGGVSSSDAVVKVTFSGYTSFTVYYKSWAESGCDYIYITGLDAYDYSTSYKQGNNGTNQSGTSISSYSSFTYACSSSEHYFYVVFHKDGSVNSNDDKGYFFLVK